MAVTGYAFITAYLKGEESKLITSGHLNDITKSSNFQEIIDAIRGTDIGGYLEELDIRAFDEVDSRLWEYFNGCLSRLMWLKDIPRDVRKILDIYIRKYDVLNIKTALHNLSSGEKLGGIPAGTIHDNGLLDELMNTEDTDGIINVLNSCKLQAYASVVAEYRLEEGIDPAILTDTKLENLYYRELLDTVKSVKDGATITRTITGTLDIANLQMLLRTVIKESDTDITGNIFEGGYLISGKLAGDIASVKLSEIPQKLDNIEYRNAVEEIIGDYERSRNIAVVDRVLDKLKLKLAAEILAPRVMSPAVVIWYLLLKEIEIRNTRLILKAVLDNISPEEIEDNLVFAQ